MKNFYVGFVLGVIVISLLYIAIFKTQQIVDTDIISQTDTVYVEIIDTVYIQTYKIKPQIIYRDKYQTSYTAIIDTTIVQQKVSGRFVTSFHHPQKLFDIAYSFQVKSDSTVVYIKQTIKETIHIQPSRLSLTGQGYMLSRKRQQDVIFGAGVTGYFDRYGLTIKGQTDGYVGLGISIKF